MHGVVSVNLAIALAAKGLRVGLMDVDIDGPDIPAMLRLRGMLDVNEHRKLKPIQRSDTELISWLFRRR